MKSAIISPKRSHVWPDFDDSPDLLPALFLLMALREDLHVFNPSQSAFLACWNCKAPSGVKGSGKPISSDLYQGPSGGKLTGIKWVSLVRCLKACSLSLFLCSGLLHVTTFSVWSNFRVTCSDLQLTWLRFSFTWVYLSQYANGCVCQLLLRGFMWTSLVKDSTVWLFRSSTEWLTLSNIYLPNWICLTFNISGQVHLCNIHSPFLETSCWLVCPLNPFPSTWVRRKTPIKNNQWNKQTNKQINHSINQ